jgi:hypothetical protein
MFDCRVATKMYETFMIYVFTEQITVLSFLLLASVHIIPGMYLIFAVTV